MAAKANDSEKSRLKQLTRLALSLPEAVTNVTGRKNEHRQFVVGKKTFGYYLHLHHNDGVIGLCAKVPPGENTRLAANDPKRYYIPAYLGPSGWVPYTPGPSEGELGGDRALAGRELSHTSP